jgi:thiol-disulfide isomerase/thioredoxin
MRLIYFILLCAILPALTFGQSDNSDFAKLKQEYQAKLELWNQKHKVPMTDAESVTRHKEWPGWNYASKLAAFAEVAEAKQDGFDAICEVLDIGNSVGEFDQELFVHYERSIDLLLEYHNDKDLRPLCSRVRMSKASERFLTHLAENAERRETRAAACFNLGKLYAEKRELLSDDSWAKRAPVGIFAEYNKERCAKYFAPFLEGESADNLYIAANRCFDRVTHEYSDIEDLSGGTTLGERARRMSYELKHLTVGGSAPEIEGGDLQAAPMKLSESRGKVVLLVFWASWCGPCIGDIPHEKVLQDKFSGRPFVILGVNADKTLEAAQKAVSDNAIPWRSFYNGPRDTVGSIVDSWNVRSWPTVYIIDHNGTIRFKHLRREELDEPLEQLIREAEKAVNESK